LQIGDALFDHLAFGKDEFLQGVELDQVGQAKVDQRTAARPMQHGRRQRDLEGG